MIIDSQFFQPLYPTFRSAQVIQRARALALLLKACPVQRWKQVYYTNSTVTELCQVLKSTRTGSKKFTRVDMAKCAFTKY